MAVTSGHSKYPHNGAKVNTGTFYRTGLRSPEHIYR
jgi:hypothetical protein